MTLIPNKQPSNIIAVTGTSGKTSVASFYQQIVSMLGESIASIGTLGVVSNVAQSEFQDYSGLTTPGSTELRQILDKMHSLKIDNVIIEASSHGLKQSRMAGVKLKMAAFTSFSQDHLDYHGTMEDYLESKLLLFNSLLEPGSVAVINRDMSVSEKVIDVCNSRQLKVLTYGQNGEYIKVLRVQCENGKSIVEFTLDGRICQVSLNLFGDFQIHNALCALALVINSGFKKAQCLKVLSLLKPVPGRMERVGESNIFIDYSHKPEALEKALQILQTQKSSDSRVLLVFGCGGDRDKGKRRLMGEIASNNADMVFVTDDNPRTEVPDEIRKEIMRWCRGAIEIAGRKTAIETAISEMHRGDFLLIAGKGHEKYQIIGDKKIPFDEYEIVTRLLDGHI